MEEFLKDYFHKIKKANKKTFKVTAIILVVIILLITLAIVIELMDYENIYFSDVINFFSKYDETMVLVLLISSIPLLLFINSLIFILARKTYSDWPLTRFAIDEKDNVAWVYKISTTVKVYGASVGKYDGLAICHKYGKRFQIKKIKKDLLEQLLPQIQSYYPKATIGWSSKLDEQYIKDPSSLQK